MLTIMTVYRSGGDFEPKDVEKLLAPIVRNPDLIGVPFITVCLTDDPDGVAPFIDLAVPLRTDWPCWWSKMEMFDITIGEGPANPVLYLDLDMIIFGSLGKLVDAVMGLSQAEVLMLRDFYHPGYCSTVMGWNSDMSWLTAAFRDLIAKHDPLVRTTPWVKQTHGIGCIVDGHAYHGDQDFIQDALRGRMQIKSGQDFTNGIYSYKVHVRPSNVLPRDARLLVFHGHPRPHEAQPFSVRPLIPR